MTVFSNLLLSTFFVSLTFIVAVFLISRRKRLYTFKAIKVAFSSSIAFILVKVGMAIFGIEPLAAQGNYFILLAVQFVWIFIWQPIDNDGYENVRY